MVVTAKEFAERHNVDYQLANGFLRLLEQTGHVHSAGTRPNPLGRGKGSNTYEVPDRIELDLTKPLIES